MSNVIALSLGSFAGLAAGALLLPLTQRELAAAMARSSVEYTNRDSAMRRWQMALLVLASGLLPGAVIFRAGWSLHALPPLLLLIGLVQLAYCDLTRFLLPKAVVHGTTVAVTTSAVIAAAVTGEWHRLIITIACGVGFFVLLFSINLMNAGWMAFGDVRLAPAIGVGLSWITPIALLQGFFVANVLAAIVGLAMIATRQARRKTALPFGLFLTVASAIIVLYWS